MSRQLAFDTLKASFHHYQGLLFLVFTIVFCLLLLRRVYKFQEHFTALHVVFPILVFFWLSVPILSFVELSQLCLPSLSLNLLHVKLSLVVLDVNEEGWWSSGAEEVIVGLAFHHHVVVQGSWFRYHGGVPGRIATPILLTLCCGNSLGLILHNWNGPFIFTRIISRLFSNHRILFLLSHKRSPGRHNIFR